MRGNNKLFGDDELEENSVPEPNLGCWLWIGDDAAAYPAVERRWQSLHGPLPNNARLQSRCTVDSCVNPAHYLVG